MEVTEDSDDPVVAVTDSQSVLFDFPQRPAQVSDVWRKIIWLKTLTKSL